MLLDNYKHKGLRRQLVNQLKEKGISDPNVLLAIDTVPRHLFMDNAFLAFAYQDKAFPIAAGQTISQPYTVAYQTELLQLKRGEKVLEIGTGSGYQTCVLVEMGAKVFSIERQKTLFDKTKRLLQQLNYNAKLYYGDGYKGLPPFAPFDKILVTAGAPFIPPPLVDQLKPLGRLVIPVGASDVQVMTVVDKNPDGSTHISELDKFKFVPLLINKEH